MNRYIGEFSTGNPGPLLICFGGMHGNEPAGIKALQVMFDMLKMEPTTNPDFEFKGKIIGLYGNLKAIKAGERYIERDLNRMWTSENIKKVKQKNSEELAPEEQELKSIIETVEKEIEAYQPKKIVVLDLHTTTAKGGIFVISTDDPESVRIGIEMHAPVVKGMLSGIEGTTLHYFNSQNFNFPMVPVTFESGQHQAPLSVNRAIAAITNCMRTIGCVKATDVENRHDNLLITYSKKLPKVTELISCHHIKDEDDFVMHPGYLNFQKIKKGEILAHDKNGDIEAEMDGHILMPLYQKQGEDGFFVIKKLDGF